MLPPRWHSRLRCKTAEGSFVQLYHSLHECADPAMVLAEAVRLIEGRDGQVDQLLTSMETLNAELDEARESSERLRRDLSERERELDDAKRGMMAATAGGEMGGAGGGGGGGGGGGSASSVPGGALSLAEREELIRLRSEVAEFEVEFRGLKNQDITIRKLESKSSHCRYVHWGMPMLLRCREFNPFLHS